MIMALEARNKQTNKNQRNYWVLFLRTVGVIVLSIISAYTDDSPVADLLISSVIEDNSSTRTSSFSPPYTPATFCCFPAVPH